MNAEKGWTDQSKPETFCAFYGKLVGARLVWVRVRVKVRVEAGVRVRTGSGSVLGLGLGWGLGCSQFKSLARRHAVMSEARKGKDVQTMSTSTAVLRPRKFP